MSLSQKINSELKDDHKEEAERIGEKFDSLLNASSSLGTHFKFNLEKRWDDSKNVTIPSYFTLNLESVAEKLSKLPFFELMQINQPILDDDSLLKTAGVSYDSSRTKNSIAKCLENADISKDFSALILDPRDDTNAFNEDENLTRTGNNCPPVMSPANESLEDWLDSVLDEYDPIPNHIFLLNLI